MAYFFDENWTRNRSVTDLYAGAPVAIARSACGPRRGARREFPIRHVGVFILMFVMLKIVMLLNLGSAAYGAKLAVLSEGTMVERIAANAMAVDPLTSWVVQGVRYGDW